MFRWHLVMLPPDIGVCVLPISSYFSLEVRFYNTAKTVGCLDAIAGTALPIIPSFLSSPCTSIYWVPSCAPLARKYIYSFLKYSFLLVLPPLKLARCWVRGARQDGEWKWQLLGAASPQGAAASPQGHSCEAAWGTQSNPFAVQIQEESRLQRLSNILAASFSATCHLSSDHWGAVCSAPTCRFRSKEWSVKVFCRDSPTLQFFALCNRLSLVCLLASEINSLSALDDFHNIHCDSEFQCSG